MRVDTHCQDSAKAEFDYGPANEDMGSHCQSRLQPYRTEESLLPFHKEDTSSSLASGFRKEPRILKEFSRGCTSIWRPLEHSCDESDEISLITAGQCLYRIGNVSAKNRRSTSGV